MEITIVAFLGKAGSLPSLRSKHAFLEGISIALFILMVLFEYLAHSLKRSHPKCVEGFEQLALLFLALAIVCEAVAYPFSKRLDYMEGKQESEQRATIAILNNSTQKLKTDAATAKAKYVTLQAEIAASKTNARLADARIAEAQRGAAEANQRTEEERLARLKVERNVEELKSGNLILEESNRKLLADATPRSLPMQEIMALSSDSLVVGMRHLQRKAATIRIEYIGAGEPKVFADSLIPFIDILDGFQDRTELGESVDKSFDGVFVYTRDPKSLPFYISRLEQILDAHGIIYLNEADSRLDEESADIVVGDKPKTGQTYTQFTLAGAQGQGGYFSTRIQFPHPQR